MNFDRICRFCLEEKSNLIPLFTDETLPSRIMTVCPSLKIRPDDGLPSQICSKCVWLANSSFRFHMQCRVAEVALENHNAVNHENYARKVHQISRTNDVRCIREVCLTSKQLEITAPGHHLVSHQMQNKAENTQGTQTEEEAKQTVGTMTDSNYIWPYHEEMSKQWCAYIQCNYITKDSDLVKALSEVINKNSDVHFPEIQGRRIHQMDMSIRILVNRYSKQRNSDTIPPVVDLTSDEENEVASAENVDDQLVLQPESTNIKIATSKKKSCLKRTENLDTSAVSHKKVRFTEPPEEDEDQIIRNFKEQLAHCTKCKSLFESNMDFVQFIEHLKEHGQQDIVCMKCKQVLDSPKQMFTHLSSCRQVNSTNLTDSHENESQLNGKRRVCDSEKHNETRTNAYSPQVCGFCDESFPEAFQLLDHIRLHFPYSDENNSDEV